MKARWITISAVAALMAALTPLSAQAATSGTALIDAEIRSVRLMDSGDVRVEVTYRCDERYGDAPPHISLHIEPDGYAAAWAGDGAICDGTAHTLVRRLKALDGQQIGERIIVYVDVNVVDSPSDPYPAGLWAGGSDIYSVEPDGSLSRLIDLRIQRTQVNDRGRLVVGMSYECPPGYGVGADDPDWAEVHVYQLRSQDSIAWERIDTLADDVVCDGTRHTLVKRIRTTPTLWRDDSMDPTLPVVVNTHIGIGWNAQTSWPHQ